MIKNVLLQISYDGTNFSGWQRQPGARTVCGTLEEKLSRLLGEEVKLNGCSRTDAGVHALMHCSSFKADLKMPVENIAKALNNCLSEDRLEGIGDIRVAYAKEMPEDFHARFSCKGKRYIYKIKNAYAPSVFDKNYYYQITKPLNVESMKEAAKYLVGEHDFAAFQSAGSPKETTVREIYSLSAQPRENEIIISVSGNGFLYNMVRIIAGTLVEVGLGKRSPQSVQDALISCDRQKAGHVAPPQGLYLAEVFY